MGGHLARSLPARRVSYPALTAAFLIALVPALFVPADALPAATVPDSSHAVPDTSHAVPDTSNFTPLPDSARYTLPGVDVRASAPDEDARGDFISREQIGRAAATADDAFRVVQALPGVAGSDYGASFLVRGGESDETLVRYDGFDLLEPYHIPYWGGAISILSPDVVGGMRLLRGGLPARYGRQLAGALEIESPDERPERPRYLVGAGPTQLRALLAGPTRGGGSYFVAVRHGLLAALGRLHRLDRDASIVPDFQDAIGEVRFHPAEGQEVRLLALGARENLRYDMPYAENDLNGSVRNATIGASWSVQGDRLRQRVVFSADRFEKHRVVGESGRDDGVTRALRARAEGTLALGGRTTLEWGGAGEYEDAWLALDGIRGSLNTSGYEETVEPLVDGTATRRRAEGYVSLRAPAGSAISVTAGVNVSRDFYSWGLRRDGAPIPGTPGFAFVSPRLSIEGRIGSDTRAWASMGLLHQPSFLNGLERESLPLGRDRGAAETVAGIETTPRGALLRAEGYVRAERGAGIPIQDVAAQPEPPFPLDRGGARGLELTLRTPQWARVDAQLGYAWSRAVWNAPPGGSAPDGTPTADVVPRSFDQRHAGTLALNVRPAPRWNLNATARYHTGSPYSPSLWREDSTGTWARSFGGFMAARYPDYFRLDLRLSHPLTFAHVAGGQAYVELINATGHRNVHQYTYLFDGAGPPRRESVELFPRMPAAGFEITF